MPILSRRSLLLASPAVLLVGCALTTTGGVTTVTIDITKITTDGKALVTLVSAILAEPTISVLLGANSVVANLALASANAAFNEIETITGGTLVLTADTAKVTSLVQSLISDGETIISVTQAVLAQTTGDVFTKISSYVEAAATLVPLLSLSIDLASVKRGGVVTIMTEAEALAIAQAAAGGL